MNTLTILGSALGLAALSGINLYATVAITGLAIRLGWVDLPLEMGGLDVLASWWIIGVAGGMYVVEFVADKWAWLDNIWDIAHTFIRPPAAALVALAATSQTADPVIQVIAVLAAGGIALGTHAIKTTTRLTLNAASPAESASNVVVSIVEDVVVAGSVLFVITHPIITLVILTVLTILAVWLTPKLVRALAVQVRSLGHSVRYLFGWFKPVRHAAPSYRYRDGVERKSVLLTIPCSTVRLRKIGWARHGYLVLTDRRELIFMTRKWWHARTVTWTPVEIESIDLKLGWLFRTLIVETTNGRAVFRLYRNAPDYLDDQVAEIREDLNVPRAAERAEHKRPFWWRWPVRDTAGTGDLAATPA
jgi:hypothetical protein